MAGKKKKGGPRANRVDNERWANGEISPVEPGTASLERWSREHPDKHRAMLLWAMQHPSTNKVIGRSLTAVSRAIGTTLMTITRWRDDYKWQLRSEAYKDPEGTAFQLYRALYMENYGRVDLPFIEQRMIIPITTNKTVAITPDETEADGGIMLAKQRAEEAMSVERAAVEAIHERRKKERDKVESFRGLLDMTLVEAGRLLKQGRLQIGAKDLKGLLEARQELTSWLASQDDKVLDNRIGVESARMRAARETGKDLVEAMWQDLEEIRTILSTMRTKRDAQTEMIASTYADVRRRAEAKDPLEPPPMVIDQVESE